MSAKPFPGEEVLVCRRFPPDAPLPIAKKGKQVCLPFRYSLKSCPEMNLESAIPEHNLFDEVREHSLLFQDRAVLPILFECQQVPTKRISVHAGGLHSRKPRAFI